jgi:hypothetical protein
LTDDLSWAADAPRHDISHNLMQRAIKAESIPAVAAVQLPDESILANGAV